jgi:hypothetical protein
MCNLLQVSFRTDEEGDYEDDFVNHNKKKVKVGETQVGNGVFLQKCMAI